MNRVRGRRALRPVSSPLTSNSGLRKRNGVVAANTNLNFRTIAPGRGAVTRIEPHQYTRSSRSGCVNIQIDMAALIDRCRDCSRKGAGLTRGYDAQLLRPDEQIDDFGSGQAPD